MIALPRTMQTMISVLKTLAPVQWQDCPLSSILWACIFSSHWKGHTTDTISEPHKGAAEMQPPWKLQLQHWLLWKWMLSMSSGHHGVPKGGSLLVSRDLETGQRKPKPRKACPTAHSHNPMVPQTPYQISRCFPCSCFWTMQFPL